MTATTAAIDLEADRAVGVHSLTKRYGDNTVLEADPHHCAENRAVFVQRRDHRVVGLLEQRADCVV